MFGQWISHQNKVHFIEVHSPLWSIFNTSRSFGRRFVLCFCNSNRSYTCCNFSTMLFKIAEGDIVNWFQFRVYYKMTWLVFIFYVELVIQKKKWILPAFSSLRVYSFNLFTNAIVISNNFNDHWTYGYFPWFLLL